MLLFLQKYDLKVTYKKGTEMYIADTLSRAFLKTNSETESCEDVFSMREATIRKTWEKVKMTTDLALEGSERQLHEIRSATRNDEELQDVKRLILAGWPDNKNEVKDAAKPYFNIREELTCQNDIIIPQDLRRIYKGKVHTSRIGIEGYLRRAREQIYWPRMNAELRDYISKCPICLKYRNNLQKEPILQEKILERPWQTVSTDLLQLGRNHYLLIVDNYSNFIDYAPLRETTSSHIVNCMKSMFSRFGIPEKVISDNGPQYDSKEFKEFAEKWKFLHATTTPRYPQASGKAENAVKTFKALMKKNRDAGNDIYLALLDWRNTPSEDLGSSPAQRLLGGRTRTLLPAMKESYRSEPHLEVRRKLQDTKEKQAKYYNRHVSPWKHSNPTTQSE